MQKTKIFYVEDDLDDVFIFLHEFSQDPHFEVTHFDDSIIFLKHLQQLDGRDLPDIILTDYRMPKLNGLDLVSKIRSNAKFSDITLAIYSTTIYPVQEADCLGAGADFCIQKPQSLNDYARLLRRLKEVATS
jgi:CheY-like chemotaxis protein